MNKSVERDFEGVWIPKEIYLNDDLNALEKIIFTEINSLDRHTDGGDYCYASNEYLADFCKCSKRKVTDAISKLISIGVIRVVKTDGRKRWLESYLKNGCEKFATKTSKKCYAEKQNLLKSNTFNKTVINKKILNGTKQEFCTSILEKEIEKAFRETEVPFNEDIEKAIIYFYKAYKNTFWVEHPRINQKAMNGVINRFSEVALDLDYEQYVILIDEYFSKECYKADYNICHFATEGILQNLYYETIY